jgi:hypothetical protein
MQIGIALAIVLVLAGCATPPSGYLPVPVDPAAFGAAGAPTGRVTVVDARQVIRMERTTIGAKSMGRIVLQPYELDLVRALVASRLPAGTVPVRCEIRTFDVITPATALYWDITTNIELVLKLPAGDRIATSTATERTYAWPSDELIGKVTAAALKQAGAGIDKAISGQR